MSAQTRGMLCIERNACQLPPPKNAHPRKTEGEGAARELTSTDSQWEPGSYLGFNCSHTKFMPKLCHAASGQADAQVVERGQGLTWHIMAPNPQMIYGCEKNLTLVNRNIHVHEIRWVR